MFWKRRLLNKSNTVSVLLAHLWENLRQGKTYQNKLVFFMPIMKMFRGSPLRGPSSPFLQTLNYTNNVWGNLTPLIWSHRTDAEMNIKQRNIFVSTENLWGLIFFNFLQLTVLGTFLRAPTIMEHGLITKSAAKKGSNNVVKKSMERKIFLNRLFPDLNPPQQVLHLVMDYV